MLTAILTYYCVCVCVHDNADDNATFCIGNGKDTALNQINDSDQSRCRCCYHSFIRRAIPHSYSVYSICAFLSSSIGIGATKDTCRITPNSAEHARPNIFMVGTKQRFNLLPEWKDVIIWYVFFMAYAWACLDASKIVHKLLWPFMCSAKKESENKWMREKPFTIYPVNPSYVLDLFRSHRVWKKRKNIVRMMMVRPNGNYLECSSSAINYGDNVSLSMGFRLNFCTEKQSENESIELSI